MWALIKRKKKQKSKRYSHESRESFLARVIDMTNYLASFLDLMNSTNITIRAKDDVLCNVSLDLFIYVAHVQTNAYNSPQTLR